MKSEIKPYLSRGRRISQSAHHPDMWIVDIVGTNKFYTLTMSSQLMLKNNPPDPEPKKLGKSEAMKILRKFDFSSAERAIAESDVSPNPMLNTGRIITSGPETSNS
jgi:hypothetical protein